MTEMLAPKLIKSKGYQNLTISGKRIALAQFFKDRREEAKRQLAIEDPKLALQISIEGLSGDIKKVLEGK